jgi:hypothetical protein
MEGIVVGTNQRAVELKLYVHKLKFNRFCFCNKFQYRPNGVTFVVPPEDVLIAKPAVGDVVSFSFESHNRRDVPVGPKIYRIRTDVSWEDLVRNTLKDNKSLNGTLGVSMPKQN